MTEPTPGGVPLREHTFDDDIREFDNRLPRWWLWTFYLACIFSVLYWGHYHLLRTGALPRAEFAAELRLAEQRQAAQLADKPVTRDGLLALSRDAEAVRAGREVFASTCVACHKADAGGLIGPNLTDAHWLYGGAPEQIYQTVTKGSPDPTKGMVAWLPALGAFKCQQVTAYVLTLKDTNVAGGKAPEGTSDKSQ
jgi:cytochrome c oxidase cbb3-type subunit 3